MRIGEVVSFLLALEGDTPPTKCMRRLINSFFILIYYLSGNKLIKRTYNIQLQFIFPLRPISESQLSSSNCMKIWVSGAVVLYAI